MEITDEERNNEYKLKILKATHPLKIIGNSTYVGTFYLIPNNNNNRCMPICHGKGVMKYEDGDVYEGEWRDGKIKGRGKYKFANGAVYEGEFKNDIPEGKGKIRHQNGDVYDGDWVNGCQEGNGKIILQNGDIYDGEWEKDMFKGRGIFQYKNGDVYKGNFKDDLKDGEGVLTLQNGDVYYGEWKGSQCAVMQNGTRIYRYVDGVMRRSTNIEKSEINKNPNNILAEEPKQINNT